MLQRARANIGLLITFAQDSFILAINVASKPTSEEADSVHLILFCHITSNILLVIGASPR